MSILLIIANSTAKNFNNTTFFLLADDGAKRRLSTSLVVNKTETKIVDQTLLSREINDFSFGVYSHEVGQGGGGVIWELFLSVVSLALLKFISAFKELRKQMRSVGTLLPPKERPVRIQQSDGHLMMLQCAEFTFIIGGRNTEMLRCQNLHNSFGEVILSFRFTCLYIVVP